jgi:hypothetical protein
MALRPDEFLEDKLKELTNDRMSFVMEIYNSFLIGLLQKINTLIYEGVYFFFSQCVLVFSIVSIIEEYLLRQYEQHWLTTDPRVR